MAKSNYEWKTKWTFSLSDTVIVVCTVNVANDCNYTVNIRIKKNFPTIQDLDLIPWVPCTKHNLWQARECWIILFPHLSSSNRTRAPVSSTCDSETSPSLEAETIIRSFVKGTNFVWKIFWRWSVSSTATGFLPAENGEWRQMLVSSDPEQINRPLVDQPRAFTQPSWPSITVDKGEISLFRIITSDLSVKNHT